MAVPFVPITNDAQAGLLPVRLAEVLDGLLQDLASGQAIQVITVDAEIGTQQAAELLSVSRPYVVKLVEEGTLPYRKVGQCRRLYLEDVLACRAKFETQRQSALSALADDLQDLDPD